MVAVVVVPPDLFSFGFLALRLGLLAVPCEDAPWGVTTAEPCIVTVLAGLHNAYMHMATLRCGVSTVY